MKTRHCELCKVPASLYCESDSAFLCWSCDAKVHQANFLVARHVRQMICSECNSFGEGAVSGIASQPKPYICHSCEPVTEKSSSSCSSSSTCTSSSQSLHANRSQIHKLSISNEIAVHSSESRLRKGKRSLISPTRIVDWKTEGILVNWCRKLGIIDRQIITAVSNAFGSCRNVITILPLRVILASVIWVTVQSSNKSQPSTGHFLKRLEKISGVPSQLILRAESRITRAIQTTELREIEDESSSCTS